MPDCIPTSEAEWRALKERDPDAWHRAIVADERRKHGLDPRATEADERRAVHVEPGPDAMKTNDEIFAEIDKAATAREAVDIALRERAEQLTFKLLDTIPAAHREGWFYKELRRVRLDQLALAFGKFVAAQEGTTERENAKKAVEEILDTKFGYMKFPDKVVIFDVGDLGEDARQVCRVLLMKHDDPRLTGGAESQKSLSAAAGDAVTADRVWRRLEKHAEHLRNLDAKIGRVARGARGDD